MSGIFMTMYCPNCGSLMVWKNGSIMHDPPTKRYECGYCEIIVTRYVDGSYESIKPNAILIVITIILLTEIISFRKMLYSITSPDMFPEIPEFFKKDKIDEF